MAFWTRHKIPYVNFHELNEDWIIDKVAEYVEKTDKMEINFDDLKTYVYSKINELETYMNDYFDNLDIQTEINNKLDEMYESGQLSDIIQQYLEISSLLSFNTIADMKNATNLIDGSTAMTLGVTDYLDGKINLFKIRPLTSTDIIDEINIFALINYPTLIAELLPITHETESEKQYIFITDSYGNHLNAQGKNFIQQACEYLNITNYYDFHRGSAGFSRTGDLNFLKVLQDNEGIINDKNTITDIFIFGGANDQNNDYNSIDPNIEAFMNYVKVEYPNANVYIGFVTKTFEASFYTYARKTIEAYTSCTKYGASYLVNSESIIQQASAFRNDRVHPNINYIDTLAMYTSSLIKDKMCDVSRHISPISIELSASHPLVTNNGASLRRSNLEMYQKNNVINITGFNALVLMTINFTSDVTITPEYYINNLLKLSDSFFLSDQNNNKGFIGYCNLLDSANRILDTCPFTAWIPTSYVDDKPVLNMFIYPKTNVSNVRGITFMGSGSVNCF